MVISLRLLFNAQNKFYCVEYFHYLFEKYYFLNECMLIVIPTRNRIKELTNTLNFLYSNKFFFKKIVIADSSELKIKKK